MSETEAISPQKPSGGQGGVAKAALVVGGFTLASRMAALVRDLAISHVFGASRLTDVFFIAFTIPNVLRRLVAEGGTTVAFIPVYTHVRQHEGDAAARRFLAATAGLALVGVLAMTVLGILGAPALVWLFASGLANEPESFALAVDLTRWLFPYVYFISLVALAMGALNSHGHFAAPAAAPVLLNVSMVGALLVLVEVFEQPIYALVVGVLVGGVLQLLVQVPALKAHGILVLPTVKWNTAPVRRFLKVLAPALFGLGVYQVNIIVLRQLASWLPEGHMTYYYNADRLAQFAFGVFGVAIATAALPALSEHAARGDREGLLATWRHSVRLTNLIIIPAAAGLAAIALPIVAVLYRHGAFTWVDVEHTAAATVAFCPWLVSTSAVRSTTQCFYALEDLKTPVKVSFFTVLLTLILGLLFLPWQVAGLCWALSAASWVQLVVMTLLLRRRLGQIGLRELLRSSLKQSALTVAAVAPAWGLSLLGRWEEGPTGYNGLVLSSSIAVAIALYGAGAVIFRFEGASAVQEKLLRRLRRR
jgi:putative peptidoglycan lipid II flippase